MLAAPPATTRDLPRGWLGSQLALKIAVILGDVSAWLVLSIFATSFLFTLIAIVLILRTCGQELGISRLIPSDESVDDARDSSVATLLGVTLLPFLGLYAAFGQVQDRATRLFTEQVFRNSFLSDTSVLRVVGDLARNHVWLLLLIFVGLYLLRRLLDRIHEKSGLAFVGLIVAFVEANFILLAIFGGFGVANRLTRWIRDRAVAGWWDQSKDAVLSALSVIHQALPEVVLRVLGFFGDSVWPALWTTVSQPVIWLAVAALIYGSNDCRWSSCGAAADHWPARSPEPRTSRRTARRRHFVGWGHHRSGCAGPDRWSGMPSWAISTTSICRPSTRSGWCCAVG